MSERFVRIGMDNSKFAHLDTYEESVYGEMKKEAEK